MSAAQSFVNKLASYRQNTNWSDATTCTTATMFTNIYIVSA